MKVYYTAAYGQASDGYHGSDLDVREMSVNLPIKSIPDDMARCLEDEVRALPTLNPEEVLAEVRRLGLQTPSETATIVRANRDGC